MKKLWMTGLMAIGIIIQGYGQWSAGIRIGGNLSTNSSTGIIDDVLPMDWKTGPELGLIAEYDLGHRLSLVSGVLYSRKGFTIDQGFDFGLLGLNIPVEVRIDAHLNYIETPLSLKYTLGDGPTQFYALGGISTSYATSGTIRPVARVLLDINLPSINIDFGDNNFERWNIAGTGGLGVQHQVGNGNIYADIQYKHGLTNIITDTIIDLDLKNKGFSLGIGYVHGF
jgi:hypothetical protein